MSNELLTAYAAHVIVNDALTAAKIDKQLPPQMFYNYTSGRINKGKSPFIECVTTDEGVRITRSGLQKWMSGYLKKNSVAVQEELQFDAAE